MKVYEVSGEEIVDARRGNSGAAPAVFGKQAKLTEVVVDCRGIHVFGTNITLLKACLNDDFFFVATKSFILLKIK